MRTNDVTFFSGPSARMAGRMYLPDPARNRGAGVLFCHGFGGTQEGTPVGLSTRLAEHGYTVMSFDYRGFGGSEGPRGRLDPAEQVEDAVHALAFLSGQPGVDASRIAIYGTSFGGGVAILAAHASGLPRAAAVSVPVTSGSDWLRSIMRWSEFNALKARTWKALQQKAATGAMEMVERFDIMVPDPVTRDRYTERVPLALETFHHVMQHEPIDVAHRLAIPVSVIGARDDQLVPVEQAVRLHDRLAGPKALHLVDGNHFVVYDEALAFVSEKTIDWFDHYLQ